MAFDPKAGMAEATRLTREGRLTQATELIQRLLSGAEAEPAPAGVAPQPKMIPGPQGARVPPAARAKAAAAPAARTGLRDTLRRLAERARAVEAETVEPATARTPGARFEAASYVGPAGARDYKLYVPASAAARARPLVVMLHGCTQTPDDFARGTRMNAAAEARGALVVYPAQPSSANPNRCWNWFRPEDQRRGAGEPGLIAGLVARLVETAGVDPTRIYVAGLSAGGAAAAALGALYPELFAAVGVHSGLPVGAATDLSSALAAMRQGAPGRAAARPTPTIVFHGDADRVVHPSNGAALAGHAAGAGTAAHVERGIEGGRTYSREVHRDGGGRVTCERWVLHGAGHAWSGGDPAGSHADPQGPDASREMLRFFLDREGRG